MISSQIHHDDDPLDITRYPIEKLRGLAETRGVLYWNLRGAWGKVPNAVLVNAIAANDQVQALMGRRSWIEERPGHLIYWEQTVPVRDYQAALRAQPLHPTLP